MPTLRIPHDQIEKVRELLERSLKERRIQNALFSFEGGGVYLTLYPSGVLVVQGRGAEEWIERVLEIIELPEGPLAGCDEAGKGEIFGPLVLCCAVIPPENYREVLRVAPKDTKRMDDEEVIEKAELLKPLVKLRCVNLRPERFNALYEKYGNLNRLMDDAYRKLVERVAEEFSPHRVVVDAYSSRSPFEREGVLFEKKAEDRYPEVSVASILAKSRYLKELDQLGGELSLKLPRGSGREARELAESLLRSDPEKARRLVKLTFVQS